MLQGTFGAAPIVIRVPRQHDLLIAGMTDETQEGTAAAHMRTIWNQCGTTNRMYLHSYPHGHAYWWGERAAALAYQCSGHTWGTPPAGWTATYPALPTLSGSGEDCPVCMEPLTDPLPRPDQPQSRAPPHFHRCNRHATCRRCTVSLFAQNRIVRPNGIGLCPECRAPQEAWATELVDTHV